jgi:small subunit ribosomal protein S6
MAANVYECLLLLDTNKVAGDVPAAAKQLHTILEKHHAEILASRPWDERRLAYPVKGHKKGLYYLTYFRTEGNNLIEIEHDFALNETILRQMTLRVDPKIVDRVLEVARDEHALALQVATVEEPSAEGMPMGEGMDEHHGPRRGHRRHDEDGRE